VLLQPGAEEGEGFCAEEGGVAQGDQLQGAAQVVRSGRERYDVQRDPRPLGGLDQVLQLGRPRLRVPRLPPQRRLVDQRPVVHRLRAGQCGLALQPLRDFGRTLLLGQLRPLQLLQGVRADLEQVGNRMTGVLTDTGPNCI
jgi:hypothetical protein